VATDALQRLINGAFRQSQELGDMLAPLRTGAEHAWLGRGEEVAKHLYLVIRNSQRRGLEQLLARPDVRDITDVLFREAARRTAEEVQEAWERGTALGIEAALDELKLLGIEVDPRGLRLNTTVLDRLMRDVNENASRTTRLIRGEDIIPGKHERTRDLVTIRTRESARRAGLSVDAAAKYSQAQAKEAVYRAAQRQAGDGARLYKVWVTRFGPGTCATCAKLHGTRRPIGSPFPVDARFAGPKLGTLAATLGHPPRHPNCRCRIIIWTEGIEREGRVTLATMVRFAQRWWDRLMRARRRR
jgi:hypothetical protein